MIFKYICLNFYFKYGDFMEGGGLDPFFLKKGMKLVGISSHYIYILKIMVDLYLIYFLI